ELDAERVVQAVRRDRDGYVAAWQRVVAWIERHRGSVLLRIALHVRRYVVAAHRTQFRVTGGISLQPLGWDRQVVFRGEIVPVAVEGFSPADEVAVGILERAGRVFRWITVDEIVLRPFRVGPDERRAFRIAHTLR